MPSTSQPVDTRANLHRANQLKQALTEFVTSGALKEDYFNQQKLLSSVSDLSNEMEVESVLDWFLFEWADEQSEGAIDHFLASRLDLSDPDREMLLDWKYSISSVFEIRSLGKNSLRLREMDSGDTLTVQTIDSLDKMPFKRGQYIAARLLSLGDEFIFAAPQFIMPDRETAMEALEIRRAIESASSPEAIEQAQREQCDSFCEFFGCTEMSVPVSELNTTLERFQNYLFFERRDPETRMTMAEMFKSEFGQELTMIEPPSLPDQVEGVGEVTILCDEFDGIVLLPEFNKFKRAFEANTPDESAQDWQDLVWLYIKDPDIPIVAFERVAEQNPERVEKVLQKLLGDEFSIEHLYAVLLHYKEPVEGLDSLADDEMLWDLFDGNTNSHKSHSSAAAKPKTKSAASGKARAATTKKQAGAKKQVSAKKQQAAKKQSGAKKQSSAKKATPSASATAKPRTSAGQAARKKSAAKKR